MRSALLLLPLIITILTSGCTMPGDFCIPGFTCGQTVEETHDVIVIESIQSIPDNIPPGGQLKVIAIISNVADINAEIHKVPVHLQLYDYCSGLFIEPNDAKQGPYDLQRGEKKQVEWNLKARPSTEVPVKTECTLKVRAMYQYATRSLTTLHFIDYAEMQRKINDGSFSEVGSYTSVGHGPIKPYIKVEGTQPIPVQSDSFTTVLSLKIINKGGGFLSDGLNPVCKETVKIGGEDKEQSVGPVILKDQVKISAAAGDPVSSKIATDLQAGVYKFFDKTCEDGSSKYQKLIRKESTPMPVEITLEPGQFSNSPLESTKSILASIGEVTNGELNGNNAYWYEFRDQVKVTVEPRF